MKQLAKLGSDALLVHRCRFIQLQPSAITALALDHNEELLAVARRAGTIELWNVVDQLYQERIFPVQGHVRSCCFLRLDTAQASYPTTWISTSLSGSNYPHLQHANITTNNSDHLNYQDDALLPRSKKVSEKKNHLVPISSMSSRPCQPILATADLDGFLRLYSIHSQTKIAEFYAGCGPVWKMVPWPTRTLTQSQLLLLAGDDGTIRLCQCPLTPIELSTTTSAQLFKLTFLTQAQSPSRLVSLALATSFSDNQEDTPTLYPNTYLKSARDNKELDEEEEEEEEYEVGVAWVWAGSQDGYLYRWDLAIRRYHLHDPKEQIIITLDPSTELIHRLAPSLVFQLDHAAIPWTLGVVKAQALKGQFLSTQPHHVLVGDSLGQLTIWDGAMGTPLQTLHHHKADITNLIVIDGEEPVRAFTVGVDNAVALYYMPSKSTHTSHLSTSAFNDAYQPWTFSILRYSHTHDILAAVASHRHLYTGGIDTKLQVYQLSESLQVPGRQLLPFRQNASHIASLTQSSHINDSEPRDRLIVQLDRHLEIWSLGQPLPIRQHFIGESTTTVDILESQRLLLSLKPQLKANIMCHASSQQGHCIALSDYHGTRIYFIDEERRGNDIILSVVAKARIPEGSTCLGLTPDGDILIRGSTLTSQLEVYSLDGKTPKLIHQLRPLLYRSPTMDHLHESPLTHLVISPHGKYLASCDLSNQVNIYNLETFECVGRLPKFDYFVTCLTFDSKEERIAISLINKQFWVYDTAQYLPTAWSAENSNKMPSTLSGSQEHISGIIFDPTRPELIWLYGHSFLFYAVMGRGELTKNKIQHDTNSVQDNVILYPKKKFKMIKTYQPLFIQWINDHSLVIVEKSWKQIQKDLPPPFYRVRYAT